MTVIAVALTLNRSGGVPRLQILRTKIFIEEIKREKRHIVVLLICLLVHSVQIARGVIIRQMIHIDTVG